MARPARPEVVLLSSGDTLRGLEGACRALGLRLQRVDAIRIRSLPSRGARLPGGADVLVVTSRHAVGPLLRAWLRRRREGRLEVWAAGAGTAERLTAEGVRTVRKGSELGAGAIVRGLGRAPRRVVHFRSDRAGDLLARALRRHGHTVLDRIAYRVEPASREVRRRWSTIEKAAALVVTSPSALEAWTRGGPAPGRRRLARSIPVVVLGARTARAARGAGFRRVVVSGTTDPQRFARLLVRAVAHANG
jgi:uroporphyrinogen-III synthase